VNGRPSRLFLKVSIPWVRHTVSIPTLRNETKDIGSYPHHDLPATHDSRYNASVKSVYYMKRIRSKVVFGITGIILVMYGFFVDVGDIITNLKKVASDNGNRISEKKNGIVSADTTKNPNSHLFISCGGFLE